MPPTMQLRWTRRLGGVATVSASGSLLFITDTLSGRQFLCDTGAQMSMLPASPTNARTRSCSPLTGGHQRQRDTDLWQSNHRLVHVEDYSSFPCALCGLPMMTLSCALMASGEFSRLLSEFPDLARPTFSTADTKHGVEHHILTTG
ncbi:hypothetical protein AAFF_G00326150 [Aldrovandia affinis]|uniref:Peptidase A2 domain-containing protein n=1 Tax=Aldrovandia affinis TaxID=143900 RepID=A0AAD7T9Z9_9TELE|nr:hypothetical protein AAFF_G00326150 [Aldrovandia affinis]